jgi:plastocyanin
MKTCSCSALLACIGIFIQVELLQFTLFVSDANAQTIVQVTMQNIAFDPQDITITQGTTVKWTNQDNFLHTVTSGSPGSPNGIFNSGNMNRFATFSFVFQNTGVYPYYCMIHGSAMTGTVTVQQKTKVSDTQQIGPAAVTLFQNVPNPFNSETMFSYDLAKKGDVVLSVYSAAGQKIWEHADHSVNPGRHSVRWDASNLSGSTLGAGMYIFTLRYEGLVTSRRMVYLK